MSVDPSVLSEPLEDPITGEPKPNKGGRPKGSTDKEKRKPSRSRNDATKADTPPRNSGRFAGNKTALQKGVADTYTTIGVALSFSPSLAPAGQAMAQQSQQAAEAWIELAETNLAVRRALESMLTTSAWSKLAMAHVPIVFAVIGSQPGMFGGGGTRPGAASRATSPRNNPPPPTSPPPGATTTAPSSPVTPPPPIGDDGPAVPFNPAFGDAVADAV